MLLLLILSTIAWILVALKTRYEKLTDFVRALLAQELVSIIAGLSMSAWIIANDPFSIGFESTERKLNAIVFITGFYVIGALNAMMSWFYKHRKWVKRNKEE